MRTNRGFFRKNLAAAALIAAGSIASDLIAGGARAADYPERTVDLVIPYPAGGGIDLLLRALAEGLSAHFKQSFVVSNRTGAGGAIGITYVARSTPDGYTLLFVPALAYSVLPLMQSVGYDAKSLLPICQAFENQMALIVRPDSPLRSARDIVEAARVAPDKVTYAATAPGTITHLAAAALADAAKVKLNHVPFRGDGELMGQLIGGHVDFASVTLGSATAAGPAVRVIGIFAAAHPRASAGCSRPRGCRARWRPGSGPGAGLPCNSRPTPIWPSACTKALITMRMPPLSPSGWKAMSRRSASC
jgi:tripartite-type tricarboxylate transporter receptor subunit TctC